MNKHATATDYYLVAGAAADRLKQDKLAGIDPLLPLIPVEDMLEWIRTVSPHDFKHAAFLAFLSLENFQVEGFEHL